MATAAKTTKRAATRKRTGSTAGDGFLFTPQTFAYFDAARRRQHDEAWFKANKARYEEQVEVPFTHLILALKDELEPLLAGFTFSPRRLSRPVKRKGGEATVRANAYAQFSEPSESMFDTNPGFYIDIGADMIVIAAGMYEVSSRQMRNLRGKLVVAPEEARTLLADRTLRKHWKQAAGGGVLAGERYKRFPKEFNEDGPGAEFLWHKRWLVARHPTREDVCAPKFVANTVAAFKSTVPWLEWTRRTVGVWKRPAPSRDEGWL